MKINGENRREWTKWVDIRERGGNANVGQGRGQKEGLIKKNQRAARAAQTRERGKKTTNKPEGVEPTETHAATSGQTRRGRQADVGGQTHPPRTPRAQRAGKNARTWPPRRGDGRCLCININ